MLHEIWTLQGVADDEGRWGRAATARPEWVKSPLLIACADLELDEVVFVFDPLFRYYTEAGQRIARTHYDQSSCGEHPEGRVVRANPSTSDR